MILTQQNLHQIDKQGYNNWEYSITNMLTVHYKLQCIVLCLQ